MSEIISWMAWVLIPALIGFVAVFLWHYFRDPYVKVTTEIKNIDIYGYYAGIGGKCGGSEGDKRVNINVTLIPTKPVEVTNIMLIFSGKKCNARRFSFSLSSNNMEIPFPTEKISVATMFSVDFTIPKEIITKTNKAQIIAVANKIKRRSKTFIIDFEKVTK